MTQEVVNVVDAGSLAHLAQSDILDRAGHSDIKHIAINASDPKFANAAEVSAHNESICDSYNKANLQETDLYEQNRILVDAEFDAVLRHGSGMEDRRLTPFLRRHGRIGESPSAPRPCARSCRTPACYSAGSGLSSAWPSSSSSRLSSVARGRVKRASSRNATGVR